MVELYCATILLVATMVFYIVLLLYSKNPISRWKKSLLLLSSTLVTMVSLRTSFPKESYRKVGTNDKDCSQYQCTVCITFLNLFLNTQQIIKSRLASSNFLIGIKFPLLITIKSDKVMHRRGFRSETRRKSCSLLELISSYLIFI